MALFKAFYEVQVTMRSCVDQVLTLNLGRIVSIVAFACLSTFSGVDAAELSAVKTALAATNERDYLGAIASLRYYKKISPDDVGSMRSIWLEGADDYKGSALSKLILAEGLYRFDEGNRADYLRYILQETEVEDEEMRAEAYYSLGFLQVRDLEGRLLGVVSDGGSKEALSAGYGLTSFESSDVYGRLCKALGSRATKDNVAEKVSRYLWSGKQWRC